MFGRKKDNRSDYDKVIDEFKSDRTSLKVQEQYDNMQNVYKEIKKKYYGWIEKHDLNIKAEIIKIEKIRVERNLGFHKNEILSFSIAYFLALASSIFYFLFQVVISNFDKYSKLLNNILCIIFLLLMLIILGRIIGKAIKSENPRNLMLNISLKVLEDIEKEIAEKELKKKLEAEKLEKRQWIEQNFGRRKLFNRKLFNVKDEIAATKGVEGKKLDDSKLTNNVHDNKPINGIVNIVFNKKIFNRKDDDRS